VISKKESPTIFAGLGLQPRRFFNHEIHEKNKNCEYIQNIPVFLCLFVCFVCFVCFVVKKAAAGDIRQFSDRRLVGYPFLEIA